jgi:IS5 family transposase
MICLHIGRLLGVGVLRLSGGQVESLFDLGLPAEVAELPADLAALDGLLAAPGVLAPIEASWADGAVGFGRPTVPMDRFVRLMIVKARSGWGYETLAREVSDSLHLRRFCRIGLWDRVPDESTVRKLVRRLGADVIEDICSQVIAEATSPRAGARRFVVRAARIDSTVVESDIRYPTDLGLAQDAARTLAREANRARALAGAGAPRVSDRSRQIAGRLLRLNRSIAARTGQSRPLALRLTGEAGELLAVSVREARRLVARLRECARGCGADAKRAADRLERLAELAAQVCAQIRLRLAGRPISDRLVSISDPDARPIRKGKPSKPTEFGYVMQLAELCENTRRGARGLILPASTGIGSLNEGHLLPATGQRLQQLNLRPREVALDGGFTPGPVRAHLPEPDRLFISGRHAPHARKTNRRLAIFRVGAEGRISHLKRRYGLGRSRLKGHPGARIWAAWAILAYNLDTLALKTT